jgi:hypothetical protein
MAHFAKLDENNVVTQVVVLANEVILDENGQESEQKGIDFLTETTGYSKWKQTSYNKNFRKNYAGFGMIYDEVADVFLFPKPGASWTFDSVLKDWVPPVPAPNDGLMYNWDETTESWILTNGQS